MTKKFEGWRETEDYRSDYNKEIVIRKKDRACRTTSWACSYPTEENITIAYGLLTDFVSSLTATSENPKKTLDGLRDRLHKIAKIIHGNPNRQDVQEIYREYDVGKKMVRRGIFQQNLLINAYNIAEELHNIFIDANDLAQKLGFGSSVPFQELNWKEKLI